MFKDKQDSILEAEFSGKKVRYGIPNDVAKWRVQTLLSKEPETIAWIRTFDAGELLIDIGANVGMYTILAAAIQNVCVYAFEPESQNYSQLNKNIYYNQLEKQVKAYPIALSHEEAIGELHLSEMILGGSHHQFAREGEENPGVFIQGCYSIPLDDILTRLKINNPNYIKIDVDGLEHSVVEGAVNTFRLDSMKSVLKIGRASCRERV